MRVSGGLFGVSLHCCVREGVSQITLKKSFVYNALRFASFCFLIMRELKWSVMKIDTILFLEHIKFL